MSAEDLSSAPAFRVSDLIRHGAEPPPVALFTRWRSYPWLIVGVTCIGAFMGQVDASIVQLALPTLGRVFDCTLESVSWVALAYLLGVAAFLPIFAQLCQMFGRKLLYIIGFVVFTGASALCGFAPDLATLIAFRFLQGVGGAMLGANSMALVVTSTDKSLRARALGVYAGAQAVGISAGPVIGGLLLGTLGWPWVFWINVPFGLLAVVFGWLVLPVTATAESKPNVRLARRSPARAGIGVCRARAQSGFSLGANLAGASRFGRRRDRAHFSVPEAGTRGAFPDDRSCAA